MNGNEAAFAELFKQHYPRVYRTVHAMLSDEADAREVSQMTWIKAWQKRNRFDFNSSFTTWLHRIAVNTALDELRRRKRYWKRFQRIFRQTDDNKEEDLPLPHENNPATGMIEDERHLAVREAIAKLPEAQRTVLVLREFENYTYEEIAATLGCKTGTVMSRLHLARKKLQQLLTLSAP